MDAFDATLQHASDWQGQRIAGWTWSEKLDGVRARWTGAQLLTRGGAVIDAPAALLAGLPHGIALDIEVYAGRGAFETARLAVQCNRWTDAVRLVCFDIPGAAGDFATRIALAEALRLEVPAHGLVIGEHSMRQALATCHASGGEGYMLARPGAPYVNGRTDALLKFKHESIYEEAAA
jgi:DNA ligase-1